MTKFEAAINELENVLLQQKTRARKIVFDYKQAQEKLSMINHLIKYPEINNNEWIINEIKKILKERNENENDSRK
jgi:hypothetical protein